MWERNNGKGEDNILHNQFTAYLVTAVRRQKIHYLRIKQRLEQYELSLELQEWMSESGVEREMLINMPVLSQLDNSDLHGLLASAKKRDLYILFSKVLEDRSFVEIAAELGMGYQAVAAAYYRMVSRIRDGMGK